MSELFYYYYHFHYYYHYYYCYYYYYHYYFDCSITDAKLFFNTSIQLSMMIDDTIRLEGVHIVERKF